MGCGPVNKFEAELLCCGEETEADSRSGLHRSTSFEPLALGTLRIHGGAVRANGRQKLLLATGDDPARRNFTRISQVCGSPSSHKFFDSNDAQGVPPGIKEPLARELPDQARGTHCGNARSARKLPPASILAAGNE